MGRHAPPRCAGPPDLPNDLPATPIPGPDGPGYFLPGLRPYHLPLAFPFRQCRFAVHLPAAYVVEIILGGGGDQVAVV